MGEGARRIRFMVALVLQFATCSSGATFAAIKLSDGLARVELKFDDASATDLRNEALTGFRMHLRMWRFKLDGTPNLRPHISHWKAVGDRPKVNLSTGTDEWRTYLFLQYEPASASKNRQFSMSVHSLREQLYLFQSTGTIKSVGERSKVFGHLVES